MYSQKINVNTLLSSKILRDWGVNNKTDVDPPKNLFFFHLISPHFKSELPHISIVFLLFCSAFILLFCSCLVLIMKTVAPASAIFPARLWLCPKKLPCVYCVKQLVKFPYRIYRICSGQISCLHCKKSHKKCQTISVDIPTSESRLT